MPAFPGKATPYLQGFGNELEFSAQQDFGFVGDAITAGENPPSGTVTVMTNGSALLTMTNAAPFQVGRDEGKWIEVQGAGVGGIPLVTTILSVASSTVCTLSVAASTTVVANSAGPVIIGVAFGTDNTLAIGRMQTLVNTTNATFPGVKIEFGQSSTNAYLFQVPVLFNKPCQIEGIGGGYTSDVGDGTRVGGTRLVWCGSSSDGGTLFGAFIAFAPTGVQSLKRVALRHLWIDCAGIAQNQALIGLKLSSCQGFMIDDFYISNALAYGIYLGIGTTPTEAKDTARFSITNHCSRQLDNSWLNLPMIAPILMTTGAVLTQTPQNLTAAANTLPAGGGYAWTATTAGTPVLFHYTSTSGGSGVTINNAVIALEDVVTTPTTVNSGNVVQATPSNACAIGLSGGTAANTNLGIIQMLQISYGTTWGPAAMEFYNSDSVICEQIVMNGGNHTNDGIINRYRREGVRYNGSIVSTALAARNNVWRDGDPGGPSGGGISCMALTNAANTLMTSISGPQYIDLMQMGNGAPVVNREAVTASNTQGAAGAIANWTGNGMFRPGLLGPTATATQALTASVACPVAGCVVAVPAQGFQIGTRLRFTVILTKTAVASVNHIFNVRLTTNGANSGGTVIATITRASTNVVDTGKVTIDFVVAGPLGGSCAALATYTISRSLATATGLDSAVATSTLTASMNMTVFNSALPSSGPAFLAFEITPGAAEVLTVLDAYTECLSGGNP